jgi:hypothetical protein
MGLFDTVYINNKWIPKECDCIDDWQTKDLGCNMFNYYILNSGEIKIFNTMQKEYTINPLLKNITFNIYSYLRNPLSNKKDDFIWYEFTIYAKNGILYKIEKATNIPENVLPKNSIAYWHKINKFYYFLLIKKLFKK